MPRELFVLIRRKQELLAAALTLLLNYFHSKMRFHGTDRTELLGDTDSKTQIKFIQRPRKRLKDAEIKSIWKGSWKANTPPKAREVTLFKNGKFKTPKLLNSNISPGEENVFCVTGPVGKPWVPWAPPCTCVTLLWALISSPQCCQGCFCCRLTALLVHWFILKRGCVWIADCLAAVSHTPCSLSSPRSSLFWKKWWFLLALYSFWANPWCFFLSWTSP